MLVGVEAIGLLMGLKVALGGVGRRSTQATTECIGRLVASSMNQRRAAVGAVLQTRVIGPSTWMSSLAFSPMARFGEPEPHRFWRSAPASSIQIRSVSR
jgi:hypothetical protein